MGFIGTSIMSDGPIKLKNHTAARKKVSFKDKKGLKSGLT